MLMTRQVVELAVLIEQKSNELDDYICFDLEMSCCGLEEIDEYPEDYPEDGEPILKPGKVRFKYSVYRSGAGHQSFETVFEAIDYISKMKSRKNPPKTAIMETQNKAIKQMLDEK